MWMHCLLIRQLSCFQKGQDYMYEVRPDRRTIDLSVNSLSGKVSMELFRLVQVQTLNLSHNHFTGTIPKTIGGMKNMESLDLSNNKFCGEIPRSIFNASSYIANPELCGTPLKNYTTEEENPKTAKPYTENEDDDSAKESLYLGMGVGFAVGFWGIFGSLFLITKWRHAYYRFIDRVGDKLYVTSIVKLNNFDRLWSG
ncbi:LRR receptor-like kinase [Medicago truncatula]|uniref:LRR receptor-like kinase n=1 Tax=Medicago truncatula TaxID=3880 RepID=A0A072TG56_MEDTR|nr:LRR receptor-like kinase [Medicago truncatula]